ncbi:MAG: hypothetical protein ACRC5H_05160 [Treponemataceae bacterium]
MTNKELEKMIIQAQSETVNASHAHLLGRKIMEYVYTHPQFFFLAHAQEDDRSDFILSLYPTFCKIIKSFDSSKGTIQTYLQIIWQRNFLAWKRSQMKQKAGYQSLVSYCEENYKDEYIAENAEDYSVGFDKPEAKISAQGILCLCLKSVYHIDDQLLEKVSRVTGVSVETILIYMQKIKESNIKKADASQEKIYKRNAQYIARSQSMWEINHLNNKKSRYQQVSSRFVYQDSQWKKSLSQEQKIKLSPSVEKIAQALGENPRKIESILFMLKKKFWDKL